MHILGVICLNTNNILGKITSSFKKAPTSSTTYYLLTYSMLYIYI